MAPTAEARKRGRIDTLPSGSMRVRVFAGYDPVTGKRYDLTETVPARPTARETRREAEKVRTKLLSQIDERRNPRSRVTVNDLIDRWLDVVKLEATTRQGYVGKIEKHLRPTIGKVEVGKLDAETIDSLYAALRRCKEHCGGRSYVEHRTAVAHDCTGGDGVRACGPHRCTPLSDGSIRVIHSILKTSLNRAVRWKWLDTHFHALRHYSATELIAAGVDPRTVAGRLGHGGGGSTTLRVYSAWVPGSDRKAADAIAARMPAPPSSAPRP